MKNDNQAVQAIRDRIEQAAQRVRRSSADITLVAVSKQKPIEDIVTVYDAGIRNFGENRAEELEEKAQALSHLSDLKWHFIGHLQTRQSKAVAQYAHYFHAVDSVKIAKRLSSQLVELNRDLLVFIQVNTSGEESKGGFRCDNWQQNKQQFEELMQAMQEIAKLPKLQILGLMTMAPFDATEDMLHKIFKSMAELSAYLPAQQLSMGMSGDFEIAIEEGATHVRIGSAIFGKRTHK